MPKKYHIAKFGSSLLPKNRCGRCESTAMSKLLLALLPAAFGQQQAGAHLRVSGENVRLRKVQKMVLFPTETDGFASMLKKKEFERTKTR